MSKKKSGVLLFVLLLHCSDSPNSCLGYQVPARASMSRRACPQSPFGVEDKEQSRGAFQTALVLAALTQ